VRANLVKQDTLHQLALRLGWPTCCAWARASALGRPATPSILADALEAVIGAVYLDAGYTSGEALVHRLFRGWRSTHQMQAAAKDPKTGLQEWLQGRKMKLPQYRVVAR
jgi:ribonuclease-3